MSQRLLTARHTPTARVAMLQSHDCAVQSDPHFNATHKQTKAQPGQRLNILRIKLGQMLIFIYNWKLCSFVCVQSICGSHDITENN